MYNDFFDPPDEDVVPGVRKGSKGVQFEVMEGDGGVSSEEGGCDVSSEEGGGDAESGEEEWGDAGTAEGEEEEPVDEGVCGRGEEDGEGLDDGEKLSKHQKKLLMVSCLY